MKLKVCGMKYHDNIIAISEVKPDYLGFIFYEKSPRFFNGTIPNLSSNTKKVGVFVNHSIEFINSKIEKYDLNLIQLHGTESPDFCKQLKIALKNKRIKIIKAFAIKDQFNFKQLDVYLKYCDYFLFDTKGDLPGGNGYTFDWSVLANYPYRKPYFLSGGIGLNQAQAIRNFLSLPEAKRCIALDVNSKFENKPGFKNTLQLQQFLQKISLS